MDEGEDSSITWGEVPEAVWRGVLWLSYRGGVGFPISVADSAQRRKLCGACELKRAAEMQMQS